MNSVNVLYWLWWGLGSIVFLGCLGVVWWGLFGDRARGRRRCPRCWYDLAHTSGLTCSECGHVIENEKQLFRTRRRLIPVLIAAVVAAAGASYTIEFAQQQGWARMLPTRAMVMALPVVGPLHGDLINELHRRVGMRKLSDRQLRSLMQRCLRGDIWARPVTERWDDKYGNLLLACVSMAPQEFDVNADLLKLPARIDLVSPRPWPSDAPVCLELSVRDWWPRGSECRIHLTPKWTESEPITVWRIGNRPSPPTTRSGAGRRGIRPFPLVIDPPGRSQLDFKAVLERRPPGSPGWEQVQEETVSVELVFEGTMDDLAAIESEDLQEAMKSVFRQGVVKWTGGRSPVRVYFDPRPTYRVGTVTTEDAAIGASVEIRRDGELMRQLDIWWALEPSNTGYTSGWDVAFENEQSIVDANDTDGLWVMHVRSNPALALRAGLISSYWSGEFTLPLKVDVRERVAPPKSWWRESNRQSTDG